MDLVAFESKSRLFNTELEIPFVSSLVNNFHHALVIRFRKFWGVKKYVFVKFQFSSVQFSFISAPPHRKNTAIIN